MNVSKVTTVAVVDRIEPALPFWEGLGFAKGAEVPHGDALGFVILVRGGVELMLQTRESVRADLGVEPPAFLLYCTVDSLDRAAERGDVMIAERTTFYGARETWVRDPAGIIVGFGIPPANADG